MKNCFSLRVACAHAFFPLSCRFVLVAALFALAIPALKAESANAAKRSSAQAQFERAEKLRNALIAQPVAERSLAEYKQAVATYRRVYLITPHAAEVPAAIVAVAQLYSEMGNRFGSKYYQSSVDTFEYLLRQYPTSRYREEALLAVATIQKNQLGQQKLAKKNFEQFLKTHPRSTHKREALEALAELTMANDLGTPLRDPRNVAEPRPESREAKATVIPAANRDASSGPGSSSGPSASSADPAEKDGPAHVTGVTTFNGLDKAQVVIALDKSLQFTSSRLSKPDRIFFDLHPARLGRGVAARVPASPVGLVKTIRMAQNKDGTVRVVFEVQGAKEYTAALFDSPARLVIDVWAAGAKAAAARKGEKARRSGQSTTAGTPVATPPVTTPPANQVAANQSPVKQGTNAAANKTVASAPASSQPPPAGVTKSAAADKKSSNKKNPDNKTVPGPGVSAAANQPVQKQPAGRQIQNAASAPANTPPPPSAGPQPVSAQPASMQPSASQPIVTQPAASQPATPMPTGTAAAKTMPPVEETIAREKGMRIKGSAAERMVPPPAPKATHNGKPSLTRALGLKVGRIVIDAGHGGHDTGTIGATGLMEKDLCLDIALRLGKIIQQRLPGAEVVYTRQDDSFVGLEERTAIANGAKADLFLSIHANSSQDHHARGVETYYLNLTNSPEAMAVASRENAFARGGVHDLQDIVAKIARNEKLGESREFAEDVQTSLSKRLARLSSTTKNRGVRKAPFVVLIGADMPSVLAEVSFLSNPTEEQLLKRPDNRQRVAEGLYQGVVNYLQSVNSLSFNLPGNVADNRPAPLPQPGNQR